MPVLSEQRELFAQTWAATRNHEEAYRTAYNVRPDTKQLSVLNAASQLRNEPDIAQRIEELISQATASLPVTFTVARALELWLEIATADPDELIGLRVGCCHHCWGEGHRYQWKQHEYLAALDLAERAIKAGDKMAQLPDIGDGFTFVFSRAPNPDCPVCEGEGRERVVARDTSKLSPGARALYGGVKSKRDGSLEVLIADRQKALENATRMIGGFNDRVRIDGTLQAMLGIVKLETTDPQEASRQYLRLMAANAA